MTEPIQSANSTFSANISSLRPILAWIISQIEESPFDQAELRRIEVALEEALVNIIHYAYLDQEGEIEITCNYFPEDQIEIIIKDYGIPFNPLENGQKIDRMAPIEERTVGGLGISFMKELMDKMEYSREGDANILTLKKYC